MSVFPMAFSCIYFLVPHPPALAATSKGPTSLVGAPAEGVSDEKAAAPLGRPDEVAIHMEDEQLIEGADPDATKDSDFDWWSKYYTSVCDEQCQQQDYKDQKLDELVVSKEMKVLGSRLITKFEFHHLT